MLLLMDVENGGFQWYNVHTKFVKIDQMVQKLKSGTNTQTHKHHDDPIRLFL
jgi:hypothetical protein